MSEEFFSADDYVGGMVEPYDVWKESQYEE